MTWRFAALLLLCFIAGFLMTPCVRFWVIELLR
jgi:hypothetical protein